MTGSMLRRPVYWPGAWTSEIAAQFERDVAAGASPEELVRRAIAESEQRTTADAKAFPTESVPAGGAPSDDTVTGDPATPHDEGAES